jgi:2-hydroxychromene-2-carboxylate isomerase
MLSRVLLNARTRRWQRALAEARRRVARRPHVVSAFLQLDDPWSYLLAHYLPALAAHFRIELRVYLVEALGGGYQPAPDLLAEYAVQDCKRLAGELGIPFLDKGPTPPIEHRRALLETLAARADEADFADELRAVLTLFWRGDSEAAARRIDVPAQKGGADRVIATSQALLKKLGHYNSAMLHYAGEWYWGIDRLHYLEARLDALHANNDTPAPQLASLRQAMHYSLPVTPPAAAKGLPPLELFHSFRSPYSYVSLKRYFAIADAFGLQLVLRPVLPMVMRGMKVPFPKLLYIVRDANREAERLGVPFGRLADASGAGAERCLAVFAYAESEHRGRDFLLQAGEAIWSKGIDVATDEGMRKVTAKTGLFWPEVKAAMAGDDWRAPIEENRASMTASGAWGVPTVRLGDAVFWGQDRDWLLVRHIEELCDTGDGILV